MIPTQCCHKKTVEKICKEKLLEKSQRKMKKHILKMPGRKIRSNRRMIKSNERTN